MGLMHTKRLILFGLLCCFLTGWSPFAGEASFRPKVANWERIRPYEENPWYWQYRGEPVLLLGGSKGQELLG